MQMQIQPKLSRAVQWESIVRSPNAFLAYVGVMSRGPPFSSNSWYSYGWRQRHFLRWIQQDGRPEQRHIPNESSEDATQPC